MIKNNHMIKTILCFLMNTFILFYILFREIDEHNMDAYDKVYGIADGGRTRGIFGTIYNSEGEYDFWANMKDTNPIYYN